MKARNARVCIGLEREPAAASRGRHAVQELLGNDASISFLADAMLATSELVTNAVIHTDGPCELTAVYDRQRALLRVEVADSSNASPEPRVGLAGVQVGGMGLRVVEEIASRWGTYPAVGGKTVWFELEP